MLPSECNFVRSSLKCCTSYGPEFVAKGDNEFGGKGVLFVTSRNCWIWDNLNLEGSEM